MKTILKHYTKGSYVLWSSSADGIVSLKDWLKLEEDYERSTYEEDFMQQIFRELDVAKSLEYSKFCRQNAPTTAPEKLAWLKTNAGFKISKAGIKIKPQNPFMVTAGE